MIEVSTGIRLPDLHQGIGDGFPFPVEDPTGNADAFAAGVSIRQDVFHTTGDAHMKVGAYRLAGSLF
jgi:hypothetical protein